MKRSTRILLAAGLVGSVVPLGASTAQADEVAAFSGYSSSGWAAPIKIEFYEPMIPIPNEPQFELELGYTTVEGSSGTSRGRGSWLWPGDPVGEGAKTFLEGLGLPPQLGEKGYPVQVNSVFPTGPEKQSDEPLPGTIMRTSASAEHTFAQVGFSPDGAPGALDEEAPAAEEEAESPGALPGLPMAGGTDPLAAVTDLGAAITGKQAAAEESSGTPGLPPQIAALVDFTGYTSQSQIRTGTEVVTRSTSALGDVSLLGGIITMEGIAATSTTTSDGVESTSRGVGKVGTVTIAGQAFQYGSDGLVAAGQTAPIPGLPDDPDKALAALGITLTQPAVLKEAKGLKAKGLSEGIQVQIDTAVLKAQAEALPLGDILGQLPAELAPLKDGIEALTGFGPRIVITLGNAGTRTETVKAIAPPAPEPTDTEDTKSPVAAPAGSGTPGTTGSAGVPAVPAAPGAPVDTGAPAVGELTGAAPMGAGLPPLTTVPGALTLGGILLALGAGTWLRRIGLLALGGTSTCASGLDAGLPDLRKA